MIDPIGKLFAAVGQALANSGAYANFIDYASRQPADIAWSMFAGGGWSLFLLFFMWAIYKDIFLDARQGQFMGKWKWVLFSIDIPKNNEQTPMAVENIFAALAGTYTSYNLLDTYWTGKVTESFSFELVSIEGHTRFLVRTPAHFRDFVESLVYSQYPEAEINEVSDYVNYDSEEIDQKTGLPIPFSALTFPNKTYNLWGAEFVFVKPYPYPIRTYDEFEHQQTQTFIDPMANLLEILSKLGPGEQVWLQIVVQPRPPGWGEEAKKIVTALQGREYKAPEAKDPLAVVNKPLAGIAAVGEEIVSQLFGFGAAEAKKKEEDQWKMFKISPGERSVLERTERKLSKQCFKVKFRMVYLGKKASFSKGRGVTGITGALQQFNTSDANAFKPGGYTKTAADYFFVNERIATKQNRILRWYVKRTPWYGETNKVEKLTLMNPEELATLWHFPVMTVKASQVDKIESKRVTPPTRLPYMQRAAPAKKSEDRRGPVHVPPVSPVAPGFSAPVRPEPSAASGAPAGLPEIAAITPSGPSILGGQGASQPAVSPDTASSAIQQPSDAAIKKSGPPSNLPFG